MFVFSSPKPTSQRLLTPDPRVSAALAYDGLSQLQFDDPGASLARQISLKEA